MSPLWLPLSFRLWSRFTLVPDFPVSPCTGAHQRAWKTNTGCLSLLVPVLTHAVGLLLHFFSGYLLNGYCTCYSTRGEAEAVDTMCKVLLWMTLSFFGGETNGK